MTVWAIEVQHSSDSKLDGKWFELDRTTNGDFAPKLWEYFFVKKENPMPPPRKVRRPITGSYAGRPGRIRIVS